MTAASTNAGSGSGRASGRVGSGAGRAGAAGHAFLGLGGRTGRGSAVVLLVFALGHTGSASATLSFGNFSLPVGENPKAISISDCTGDDKLDLIVANQNSNDLTILRGTGAGKYEYGNTIASVDDPQPVGAVCADFTGDGMIDIAILSRNTGTLTLYRKDADGFGVLGSLAVGFGHYSAALASGDLNGDGNLDFLVVNYRSRNLVMVLGTGSDDLPTVATIPLTFETASDTPVSATIADFNSDGHADIAIASSHSPYLEILLGDGKGSFQPLEGFLPFPFGLSRRPPRGRGVAAADLNGDGRPDIALLSTEGTVTLYLGTAAGGFVLDREFGVPPGAAAIALADLSGDGRPDLALVDDVTNSVQILPGTSNGGFAPTGAFASSTIINPLGAAVPRATLIEADDTLASTELLYLDQNRTAPALEVLTALDPSGLAVTPLRVFPKGEQPQVLRLVDLTDDGIPDAVVMNRTRPGLRMNVLRGNAAGGFDPALDVLDQLLDKLFSDFLATQMGPRARTVAAGDLDGDGKQDLVIEDNKGKLLLLADDDGQGRFRQVRQIGRVNAQSPVALADFNDDGVIDIAAVPAQRRDGALTILVNDGLGQFTAVPVPGELPPPLRGGPLLAGDFDRNGFVDLAYAVKGHGWTVLYNEGAGPATSGGVVSTARNPTSLAAADFDEDGWLDVAATFGTRGDSGLLFRGASNRRFAAGRAVMDGASLAQTTIVDINDDLHQDIVSCDARSVPACAVHYGTGTGSFSSALPASASEAQGYVGRQIRGVAAADLDGDGTVDFVGVSRREDRVVVFFRQPASSATTRVALAGGNRPRAVAVGDVNGDTRPDLVVANEASNDVSIFLNLGHRQFAAALTVPLPAKGGIPTALALGDLNGDGKLDVVVTENGTLAPNVVVLQNAGGGAFTTTTLQAGLGTRDVQLADLNEDTKLDIVVANSSDDTVSLLLSTPGEDYERTDMSTGGLQPSAVAIADMNQDDHLDLVIVNKRIVSDDKVGSVAVFLNDGAGGFFDPASVHVRGREVPSAVCTGDFDGDDVLDVAVSGGPTNDILVLRGRGDGTWRRDERTFPSVHGARSLACADVDGDGKTDVVFGVRRGGNIDVLRTSP